MTTPWNEIKKQAKSETRRRELEDLMAAVVGKLSRVGQDVRADETWDRHGLADLLRRCEEALDAEGARPGTPTRDEMLESIWSHLLASKRILTYLTEPFPVADEDPYGVFRGENDYRICANSSGVRVQVWDYEVPHTPEYGHSTLVDPREVAPQGDVGAMIRLGLKRVHTAMYEDDEDEDDGLPWAPWVKSSIQQPDPFPDPITNPPPSMSAPPAIVYCEPGRYTDVLTRLTEMKGVVVRHRLERFDAVSVTLPRGRVYPTAIRIAELDGVKKLEDAQTDRIPPQ